MKTCRYIRLKMEIGARSELVWEGVELREGRALKAGE